MIFFIYIYNNLRHRLAILFRSTPISRFLMTIPNYNLVLKSNPHIYHKLQSSFHNLKWKSDRNSTKSSFCPNMLNNTVTLCFLVPMTAELFTVVRTLGWWWALLSQCAQTWNAHHRKESEVQNRVITKLWCSWQVVSL